MACPHRFLIGVTLALGLALPAFAGAAGAAPVFVLHSYSQEYPWTRRQHQAFVERLNAGLGGEVLISTEHLGTRQRTYDPAYARSFADYLKVKYAGLSPDAVYVSDDNALDFALEHLERVFGQVPIIFSGVNDLGALARIRGRPITGLFEKKQVAPNLGLLSAIGRTARKIVFVGDGSPTYRAIEHELREELRHHPAIEAVFVADQYIDPMLDALRHYPNEDLFLTTLGGVRDGDGRPLPLQQTLDRIVDTGNRLIVSMEDVYLVDGVLGGYVTSGRRQGATAADLMLHLLASGQLEPPVTASPNQYLIDARELDRVGLALPPNLLPDVELLNPTPSFSQRHHTPMLGALAVLSVLFVLSMAVFLVVLSRKNHMIEQRSKAVVAQAEIAMRARDNLIEAERLAGQGSWNWDLESGRFCWSDGLKALCDAAPDRPYGSFESFLDQVPTGDREALVAAVEQVRRSGERQILAHRLHQTEGRTRTVRTTIRRNNEPGSGGRWLIGTVQDETARQLTESRLCESEEKYRRLLESSEDPMWLIVGQQFVMANGAASRVLGYASVDELLDLHPSRLSPEYQPDGQRSAEKADEMMATAHRNGYNRFEWTHCKKDGSRFPVEVTLTKIPYDGGEALFCIWRDITEIKNTQRALEEKTVYLDGILGSSEKVAIIATDAEGCIQFYNPSSERLFGLPAEKVLGVNLRNIHSGKRVDEGRNALGLEQAREQGEYRFTMNMTRNDGTHYIDARISPIYRGNQNFAGYMLMCEDVTEQRRASELIEYQASYDALTDLPNRRLFMDQLHQALARAKRHRHLSAAMFLDLDNFKTINDSLGHPVGDALLREVAQRIKTALRDDDTVARIGGDEFVVLVSELAAHRDEAVSDIQILAERMRERVAQPYRVGPHDLHITPSIGIAVFPSGEETEDDILRQADTAMYQAKESGRNAVRFFLPSMQLAAENRLRTINRLRHALARDELELHFQPQFNARRELTGAEALLRWNQPQRGLVLPGDFIQLAEEAGLVLPIGDWVLHQALAQFRDWYSRYPQSSPGRGAVNVSAVQFHQADFVHKIERALGDTGSAPSWLTLEMTESILLQDVEGTVEKILALKRLGIRFSIDDFGTGYSSLAYLKRLPVDEIKIDRSFVRDIKTDANDAALVDTILTMARHIGLEAVAEGVEDEAAFTFLGERGCPLFQGYY